MTCKSVCLRVSVIIAVLLTATVEANEGTSFSMTCLGEEKWFHKNKEMGTLSGNETVTLTYSDRTKGLYHCEYVSKDDSNDNSKKKFYFYVQGKVCDNCIELDPVLVMAAICADVVLTVLVILVTYKFSQNRSPAGASFTPKAAAPPRSRGPAVQSPDYEALDPNTRSHGTYSKVNRQGL